ncbi:MAG: LysR family transcriptional regulator [Rhodospirillales bacterium]
MNVKALRAFCLVMRHGNLVGASEDLNLSQPAVSRLISGLEASLHLTLFHRDKRSLRPTYQGRAFFREASRILSGIERLQDIAREIDSGRNEHLRVVAMSRMANTLAAPAAGLFARRYPDVPLTIEMYHRRDMERWLARREFDLGLEPLPVDNPGLRVTPLCRGTAVAIIPEDWDLAGQEVIAIEELASRPLIALMPDTLLQGQTDAMFANAGLQATTRMRVSSSALACSLAAEGLGYAITDPFTGNQQRAGVVKRHVEPAFRMDFGVVWPIDAEPTPTALAFSDCVRDVVRGVGQGIVLLDQEDTAPAGH